MAARWCWALLLCQLAAWGSAAPQDSENSPGEANAPEFSSHHQKLTVSTQGASRTSIGSADHNSPQIIQNKQPEALQQDSVKPKETEDSSVNSQSAAAGSSNTEKDTKKVKEGQTGISDTLPLPNSETTELKQRESPSIKTPNVKLEGPPQERNPVQTKTVQENSDRLEEPGIDAPRSDLNKKPKQSENVEPKPKPTSAKVDSSEVTNALPNSKTKELKQGGDQTVKTSNVNPDGPGQDSSKKNPVGTKTVQKNPDRLEESETDDSHLDLNVKKLEQSEDVEPEDQNFQPGQSVKKPTSAKVDSSEVTKPDKGPSLPKPKTKELKQGEDQSIKIPNVNPDGPAQTKNKKTDTDISHPDFSELDTNDEESQQIEDTLAKDQDLQSDPSAKHPQKSNPVESQKIEEEEVVDPGDEQEKGLGDEKTKIAKHEEDSEGTPKNGSENSHFFAYLVTTAIVVAALYIAYHNKRKIIAFALEGKKSKTARRPKSSDYQRLDQKI